MKGRQYLRDARGRFRKKSPPAPPVILGPPAPPAAPAPAPAGDLLSGDGPVRTDMHCTECGKGFIAQIDFSIDGNHVVECPWCFHEHCRVIENGRITEDRWSSRNRRVEVPARNVWKTRDNVLQIATTTAAGFLRERWLNFGG